MAEWWAFVIVKFVDAFSEMRGLGLGSTILVRRHLATVPVGDSQLGRVINGLRRTDRWQRGFVYH